MPGHIILQNVIQRIDVQHNPDVLYVFGDNMAQQGTAGQASYGRRMRNAVGIPTKHIPSMDPAAMFADDMTNGPLVVERINEAFDRLEVHLHEGGVIVWPENGIGTGMAMLRSEAPNIFRRIAQRQVILFKLAGREM